MCQTLHLRYNLSWIMTLQTHVKGNEHQYFIFLEATQIQRKEPLHPISILGWIVKSESPLALSTLKVLDSYNILTLV